MLGLCCNASFSLVAGSEGDSLAVERGLSGTRASEVAAPRLWRTDSTVVAWLSCSIPCGILPDQGSDLCLLPLAGGLFTTEPPGQPSSICFIGTQTHPFMDVLRLCTERLDELKQETLNLWTKA